MGPGHVEEVVAGEADAHGLGVPGAQRPVDAALVVGVDLGLGGVGRLGPAVNLGLDPFHRQVGALDQADLDLGPSRCTASLRPLGEPSQGIEGVGQVGLQDDPGREAGQVRLVEQLGERPDGELEVPVLLHVEVHECGRRRVRRSPVEHPESVLDAPEGVVEGPEVDLAGNGRDLDRHVVDLGVLDQPEGFLEASLGLPVPEHGLAEQVDVEGETP